MREATLRTVLLVKAVEETDVSGTLIPPADRAAATREAKRGGDSAAAAVVEPPAGGRLPAVAQRLLALRAATLRRQLGVRYPFVDTLLELHGAAWIGRLLVVAGLLAGASLSALDGTRRINILAFPLLGLLLWNLLVYVLIAVDAVRGLARRPVHRPSLAGLLTRAAVRRARRLVARSAAFNAVLAEALGRFVAEWSAAVRPLLRARALRLLHLSAAAVGIGLIAGLYLRGVVLDYRAGWESTFLDAQQVHTLLSVAYAPASAVTGIPIPSEEHIAAVRVTDDGGGESAAPWIHLLAATVLLFVVLPRLLLALLVSALIWQRAARAPLPASLLPYFRSVFGADEAGVGRGIVAVMPYSYEPAADQVANLRRLLPEAFGEALAVDLHAPARYGEEETFLAHLADRGGEVADVIALLFNLAATPEDENHGIVIAGVRDWLVRARRAAQLIVLVDEAPYAARLRGEPGADARLAERRQLWRDFVAARGLTACFVDFAAAGPAEDAEEAGRLRAAAWQPAPG